MSFLVRCIFLAYLLFYQTFVTFVYCILRFRRTLYTTRSVVNIHRRPFGHHSFAVSQGFEFSENTSELRTCHLRSQGLSLLPKEKGMGMSLSLRIAFEMAARRICRQCGEEFEKTLYYNHMPCLGKSGQFTNTF